MDQRITLITLGVTDLGRARSFYEALGWRSDGAMTSRSGEPFLRYRYSLR
jgi:predicted lactoylglutathione lyase